MGIVRGNGDTGPLAHLECGPDPERALLFFEAMNAMSTDAREIIGLILEAPHELVEECACKGKGPARSEFHGGKTIRGGLRRYLKRQGWTYPMVRKAFREIRRTVYNL